MEFGIGPGFWWKRVQSLKMYQSQHQGCDEKMRFRGYNYFTETQYELDTSTRLSEKMPPIVLPDFIINFPFQMYYSY